jgi:hypothetical protein
MDGLVGAGAVGRRGSSGEAVDLASGEAEEKRVRQRGPGASLKIAPTHVETSALVVAELVAAAAAAAAVAWADA